jgi:ceramide glucosyltransferase
MFNVSTLFNAWLLAVCVTITLISCGYALFAGWSVRRFAARPIASPKTLPNIVVLKPLHRAEPELGSTLATLCRQDYAGSYSIVFGVCGDNDPAINEVAKLQAQFPHVAMRLVVDSTRHGSNGKISNLINMAKGLAAEVVVFADSDIAVEPDYLGRLIGALDAPGVGAVTCLYRGRPVAGFWSGLTSAGIDQHFLPNAIAGITLGLAKPCFGSTIALRRETLNAIGGFERVADKLADDHAIGAAVQRLGLKVAVAPFVVEHNCCEDSLNAMWSHELRWGRTIRTLAPAGYIGSGITHTVPLAFLTSWLAEFSFSGLGVLALALACRLWVQTSVRRSFGGSRVALALGPCRDIVSALVYLSCFASRSVTWRGSHFTVARDSDLVPTLIVRTGSEP